MDIIEAIRSILLNIPATTDIEALTILKGVAGRGEDQYGSKLRNWLESNPSAFPEQIEVEVVDHVRDAGVDVILTGQTSKLRIGFQIKSDNDLANKEFTRELKAQVTESRRWGLSLYVVILACRPTQENQQKYLHIVNELGRSPDDYVLIITPTRAAGLLRAFNDPMPAPVSARRNWSDFFIAVDQPDLVSQHVDEWGGLEPDARFQPPAEFDELLQTVKTSPLTILTGPPAVGKTFSAMQVLWREFQENREVEWITPKRFETTEGVIANHESPPDMPQRIELLTRHLGLTPRLPPLDSTEFVAAHLKPNSTIYIEDPFGKTDDEFRVSMHTYHFFDLNRFVAEISEGAARFGCRILITSREALFERWLSESRQKGEDLPRFTLMQVNKHSYEQQQHLALARALASARGVKDIDEAARIITPYIDVPFDAEVIVRGLPAGATLDQVSASAEKSEGTLTDKLRNRVGADTDGERLFLLLLIALAESGRVKHNNFYEAYTSLHAILSIEGDAGEALRRAAEKYRSIISRREIIVMEPWPGGGINLVPRNDDRHYNLEPVHSTVIDAISSYLRSTSQVWLETVAASLSNPAGGLTSRLAQTEIAYLFIRWGIGGTEGPAQEGMLEAVFHETGKLFFDVSAIMASWSSLPLNVKERLFRQLEAETSSSHIAEACSWLDDPDITPADAWRFVRLLLGKPGMGLSQIPLYGHPWRYLAEHLDEMPADLKESLDRQAEQRPAIFTYALSEVLVERWDKLPENWRAAFLNPKVMEHEHARQNLFAGIADNWNTCPEELKKLFLECSRHEDYQVRAAVGISALVYHEAAPEDLEPVYMATIEDKHPHVPLLVMRKGMGDDDHDRKFAEALYEKAGEAASAWILARLTERGEPTVDWKLRLADLCAVKGGDLSRGVLAHHCLENRMGEFMDYRLADSPEGEPEAIRFAWLWAYIRSEGRQPALSIDIVSRLINGLSPQYRHLALHYLSVQANYLPHSLEDYLEKIEGISDADREAIEEGCQNRQPPGSTGKRYGFPVARFINS